MAVELLIRCDECGAHRISEGDDIFCINCYTEQNNKIIELEEKLNRLEDEYNKLSNDYLTLYCEMQDAHPETLIKLKMTGELL